MTETWDTVADWYAECLRHGSAMHEFARDILLAALPADMTGARVLDVGCGEGIITRSVATRGADVVGIDLTAGLIAHAQAAEDASPTGAGYEVDDGCTLSTVASESVDWVTAGLALNNIPDLEAAVRSVRRQPRAGSVIMSIIGPKVSGVWLDARPRVREGRCSPVRVKRRRRGRGSSPVVQSSESLAAPSLVSPFLECIFERLTLPPATALLRR
jgi:SAM-dependent methyltransferase